MLLRKKINKNNNFYTINKFLDNLAPMGHWLIKTRSHQKAKVMDNRQLQPSNHKLSRLKDEYFSTKVGDMYLGLIIQNV